MEASFAKLCIIIYEIVPIPEKTLFLLEIIKHLVEFQVPAIVDTTTSGGRMSVRERSNQSKYQTCTRSSMYLQLRAEPCQELTVFVKKLYCLLRAVGSFCQCNKESSYIHLGVLQVFIIRLVGSTNQAYSSGFYFRIV